jgi:predicted small lipoprotein YifL
MLSRVPCRRRLRTPALTSLLLLAVLAVAGCGQKGPLYLPKPAPAAETGTATDRSAPEPAAPADAEAPVEPEAEPVKDDQHAA